MRRNGAFPVLGRDQCRADAPACREIVSPVRVRLEVATGRPRPATPAGAGGPSAAPAREVSDDPEEHLAGTDVHDLDDAPDAPTGGIDALTQAFPGAELVDPS